MIESDINHSSVTYQMALWKVGILSFSSFIITMVPTLGCGKDWVRQHNLDSVFCDSCSQIFVNSSSGWLIRPQVTVPARVLFHHLVSCLTSYPASEGSHGAVPLFSPAQCSSWNSVVLRFLSGFYSPHLLQAGQIVLGNLSVIWSPSHTTTSISSFRPQPPQMRIL